MKHNGIFVLLLAISLLLSCGPDEEEPQQRQLEARQDSLERVRRQRQQQRMDSLAAARADSIAAANAVNEQGEPVFNPQAHNIAFAANGAFAVQTGAWRSKRKAEQLAEQWQTRGFEQAFVVKYGNAATGNVWFRVRLGRFASQSEAEKLQAWLRENYQRSSWIAYAE